MTNIYIGYIIKKSSNKTVLVKSPFILKTKPFVQIKYKSYLVHDERNETNKGDWITFKIISCKSKFKYFKINKIIKTI
uniref:30S ribosomal protein S17 n=1 Tax=Nephromyces sp. ex Molgula occidentalis TaxID=2544991 RepID=A0A5C1H806_9APIC|nr:30S ribosomal protein S17 [Nephromyces sp. ex Molgula occidentalis]